MLLEQELIERSDIENLVCPVLVDLTAPDSNDDVKTEAMAVGFFIFLVCIFWSVYCHCKKISLLVCLSCNFQYCFKTDHL